jgi:hypothetical protein
MKNALLAAFIALPASAFAAGTTCSAPNLTYFGAQHATDPAHPQFAEIERLWNASKPAVAFFEGPNRPLPATRDEVIRQTGESGLVRFLATRDNVPFHSLEPAPLDEVDHVLKSFSIEKVGLFYTLREASRLRERQGMNEQQITERIDQMLKRLPKIGNTDNPFKTSADVAAAYGKYWTQPAAWWQAPKEWFDPMKPSAATGGIFTNEINALSSGYRDIHMIGKLAAAKANAKVFAVVGRNHALAQAASLHCAVTELP